MHALDTNILLRFLLKDDPPQFARAAALFKRAEEERRILVVSTLVLLELVWVLENVYEFEREEILNALEQLGALPSVAFHEAGLVGRFLDLARASNLGFEYLLIGLEAERIGAAPTLTFDKRAARHPLFKAL